MIEKNILKCFWIPLRRYYLYLDLVNRNLDLIRKKTIICGMRFINSMEEILNQQDLNYDKLPVL